MTGTQIAEQLRRLLQDEDLSAPRYTDAELLAWLNEAYLALIKIVPAEGMRVGNITLAAGINQSLPDGGIALIEVRRNMGINGASPGRVLTLMSREALDAFLPDWPSSAQTAVLLHYMPDVADASRFYVYPPALPDTTVEAKWVHTPESATSLSETIKVRDVFAPALVNYVAFRLYSKDADDASNAQIASAYYSAFLSAAGASA